VHTSAKARLTNVAIQIQIRTRIVIRVHDTEHHQNQIICSLAHCQPSPKISCKSVQKFLHKVANRQTDKQRRLHILLGGGNQTRLSLVRVSSPTFCRCFDKCLLGDSNTGNSIQSGRKPVQTVSSGTSVGRNLQKWRGLLCPFPWGSYRLGRGLPPYQVASGSIQPFGHNRPALQTDRQDTQDNGPIAQECTATCNGCPKT